ncbi:hypothetical protein ACJQWK_06529 [Exserohilum turcicum]
MHIQRRRCRLRCYLGQFDSDFICGSGPFRYCIETSLGCHASQEPVSRSSSDHYSDMKANGHWWSLMANPGNNFIMWGTSALEIVIATKAFSCPAEYSPSDRRQAKHQPLTVAQCRT